MTEKEEDDGSMPEKVDFTAVEQTMLTTLYLRAWESRSESSILRDQVAVDVVDRIDYDFSKLMVRGGAGIRRRPSRRHRPTP